LDMRAYVKVEGNDDNVVELDLPDVNIKQKWNVDQLKYQGNLPTEPSLDPELLTFLEKTANTDFKGILAFLFLYLIFSRDAAKKGIKVQVRSQVQVGAGLGSSAAFNVSLAAGLLEYFSPGAQHYNEVKRGESVAFKPVKERAETINAWAFQAEKIMHGTPSGIDNSVSTYGGAISFTKGSLELIPKIPPVALLLTNTKVSRNTKALVSKVGALHKQYPTITTPLLECVDSISKKTLELFTQYADETSEEKLGEFEKHLEAFIDINHQVLNGLGVGHRSLDLIVQKSAALGLHSKLTGAGGGGFAFTLLRRSAPASSIEDLKNQLVQENMESMLANVGVDGVLIHNFQEFPQSLLSSNL
jgi:mevalonate kinase